MPTPSLPDGVFTACLTPFRPDGSVDVSLMSSHIRWLLGNGSDGVLLFGTTGEGLSLTVSERTETLSRLLDQGVPPEKVMVGTSAMPFPDLVELTRSATAAGAGGVLVHPPFHVKDAASAGVKRTYNELIQCVGDADLRLYFYHFPELTGVPIPVPVIEDLLATYPEQIAGVKDSSGDWAHTKRLCNALSDLQIFAGTERLLLRVLRAGGSGCISATANVTAPLAGRVLATWKAAMESESMSSQAEDSPAETGDEPQAADSLQKTLSSLRTQLASFPMIPALKTLMAWRHGRESWTDTRPPLTSFPDDARESLRRVNIQLNRTLDDVQSTDL